MSKYYTPKIEEFHVGFEYEQGYCYFNSKDNPKLAYTNEIFEIEDDLLPIKENLQSEIFDEIDGTYNEPVRVKYLDQEDIESFGFETSISSYKQREAALFFGKELLFGGLEHKHLIFYISYYQEDNHAIIRLDNLDTGDEDITIFNGKIKNKSELKKVLQMIGVLKDE